MAHDLSSAKHLTTWGKTLIAQARAARETARELCATAQEMVEAARARVSGGRARRGER
jgi:hypothetical protein